MDSQVKISIITVSYNSVLTIEDTIKSVVNQKYDNIEYIIIDGGSTDGTVDIIKKYSNKIYYWVSEPDKGIYDAMNKGLRIATGEIIGIINSDDWYCPEIFSMIAKEYIKNPYSVIHGNLNYILKDRTEIYKPELNEEQYYKKTFLMHPTMFVPHVVYKELGYFNPQYKIAADFDLMLRIVENGYSLTYLDTTISNMRSGGESCTNLLRAYKEVKDIALLHGYSKYNIYKIYIRNVYEHYKSKLKGYIKEGYKGI